MLGLFSNAYLDFFRSRFGDDVAQQALHHVGYAGTAFVSNCPYADSLLQRLVSFVAQQQNIVEEELHFEFGRFFITWTLENGYARLMRCLGGNVMEFLRALNNLHLHLSLGNPAFVAPGFRVQEVTPTSLILHYYSQREALWPWVEGMLDEAARQLYGVQIRMEQLQGRQQGHDHEAYRIMYPAVVDKGPTEKHLKAAGLTSHMGLDPETFYELFPFHIVLDMELRVVQVGSALESLVPDLAQPGTYIKDVLRLHHPRMPWTTEEVLRIERDCKVVLLSNAGLELKGGLYKVRQLQRDDGALKQGEEVILFMGSPRLCNLEELEKHQFFLSGFPTHDMAADFVLLADQRQIEWNLKHEYEMNNIDLKVAANQLLEERLHVEKVNTNLKEALAYTLSQESQGSQAYLNPDSPADTAIKLLNSLLLGHEVRPEQVLAVRNLLLKAGTNLWQPLDFNAEVCRDDEVKAALVQMLGGDNGQAEQEDMSWLANMNAERSPKGPIINTPADVESHWQLDMGDLKKALASIDSSGSLASLGAAGAGAARRKNSLFEGWSSAMASGAGGAGAPVSPGLESAVASLSRKISGGEVGPGAGPGPGAAGGLTKPGVAGISLRPSYSLVFAMSQASDTSPPLSLRHYDSNLSSASTTDASGTLLGYGAAAAGGVSGAGSVVGGCPRAAEPNLDLPPGPPRRLDTAESDRDTASAPLLPVQLVPTLGPHLGQGGKSAGTSRCGSRPASYGLSQVASGALSGGPSGGASGGPSRPQSRGASGGLSRVASGLGSPAGGHNRKLGSTAGSPRLSAGGAAMALRAGRELSANPEQLEVFGSVVPILSRQNSTELPSGTNVLLSAIPASSIAAGGRTSPPHSNYNSGISAGLNTHSLSSASAYSGGSAGPGGRRSTAGAGTGGASTGPASASFGLPEEGGRTSPQAGEGAAHEAPASNDGHGSVKGSGKAIVDKLKKMMKRIRSLSSKSLGSSLHSDRDRAGGSPSADSLISSRQSLSENPDSASLAASLTAGLVGMSPPKGEAGEPPARSGLGSGFGLAAAALKLGSRAASSSSFTGRLEGPRSGLGAEQGAAARLGTGAGAGPGPGLPPGIHGPGSALQEGLSVVHRTASASAVSTLASRGVEGPGAKGTGQGAAQSWLDFVAASRRASDVPPSRYAPRLAAGEASRGTAGAAPSQVKAMGESDAGLQGKGPLRAVTAIGLEAGAEPGVGSGLGPGAGRNAWQPWPSASGSSSTGTGGEASSSRRPSALQGAIEWEYQRAPMVGRCSSMPRIQHPFMRPSWASQQEASSSNAGLATSGLLGIPSEGGVSSGFGAGAASGAGAAGSQAMRRKPSYTYVQSLDSSSRNTRSTPTGAAAALMLLQSQHDSGVVLSSSPGAFGPGLGVGSLPGSGLSLGVGSGASRSPYLSTGGASVSTVSTAFNSASHASSSSARRCSIGGGPPSVLGSATPPPSPSLSQRGCGGPPGPGGSAGLGATAGTLLSGPGPATGAGTGNLPGSAAAQTSGGSSGMTSRRQTSLFVRDPAVLSHSPPSAGTGQPSMNPQLLLKLLAQPPDLLTSALAKVDDWQFDSFHLASVSFGKPLSCLAFYLLKRMDLIKKFDLDEVKLARYLMRIEKGYPHNPYHCRTHAADVLRTLHCLLTRGGVLNALVAAARLSAAEAGGHAAGTGDDSDAQHSQGEALGMTKLLACYLAAVVHDYEHRGLNNVFLIRSSDPLALLYNDVSPMENHHLAASFMLMHDDQHAFFSWKARRLKEMVRKDIIEMVLATDMKLHFSLTSLFTSKMCMSRQAHSDHTPSSSATPATPSGGLRVRPDGSSSHSGHLPTHSLGSQGLGPGSGSSLHPVTTPQLELEASPGTGALAPFVSSWDHDTQILVLKLALKCADLGHLASSSEVHKEWVGRLEEEMFRQGDQERALGQVISPLMDRTKGGVTKSQAGFFNVVALPMLKAFTQVFPAASEMLHNVTANYRMWQELESQAAAVGVSSAATAAGAAGGAVDERTTAGTTPPGPVASAARPGSVPGIAVGQGRGLRLELASGDRPSSVDGAAGQTPGLAMTSPGAQTPSQRRGVPPTLFLAPVGNRTVPQVCPMGHRRLDSSSSLGGAGSRGGSMSGEVDEPAPGRWGREGVSSGDGTTLFGGGGGAGAGMFARKSAGDTLGLRTRLGQTVSPLAAPSEQHAQNGEAGAGDAPQPSEPRSQGGA